FVKSLGGVLSRHLARAAGRLQRLVAVCGHRPAGAARTPYRHVARLSGRGHRQCPVGDHRVAVEGTRLSRLLCPDAPGPDTSTAEVAAMADAPAAFSGVRPRTPAEELAARDDAPHRRFRVRRPGPAAPSGTPAARFVSCPSHGPLALSPDARP